LEQFMQQAAVRINKVKDEMTKLLPDDFEKGWAEALVQEFEYLSHQQLLSREELRLVRAKAITTKHEIRNLMLELEESEYEIDQIEMLEVETAEAKRRLEVGKIHRRVTQRMQRDIRRERCHWKIDSIRKNVIMKHRPKYVEIVSKAKDKRNIDYFTTVNFENKQRVRDYEDISTRLSLQNEARKIDLDARPKTYEEYAGPVQQTYDVVVENALKLLRGFTLENTATILKSKAKASEIKKKKDQHGQFWALKAEFQSDKS